MTQNKPKIRLEEKRSISDAKKRSERHQVWGSESGMNNILAGTF
jgi:hypothetical protein